jgi:cytidylate kinase
MVNAQLRSIVGNRDFIVMGRDIGTVVFPDAQLKVFLDASVEVRAARRHLQGGKKLDRDYIQREIEQRDSTDRQKAFGRLELAPGAVYIDTSDLTIDQVCDRVVREILKNTNIR